MKAYDWTKAPAVVAAYLSALEDTHPLRLGRSWLEVQMQKCGLVADWRGWQFGESHAAWYACLIKTKAITRVTQAESAKQSQPSKTAQTIRAIRNGRLRQSPTARYLESMLAE